MHRKRLLTLLKQYTPYNQVEFEMKKRIIAFVTANENCFENTCSAGHITTSAWIIDVRTQMVGMIHHKKLNKWLQPGGHSDGNPDTAQEALREATEEFAIPHLYLPSQEIFDIDIHSIPHDLKRGLGKHDHFDIRFLIYGDSTYQPITSDESNKSIWVDINTVKTYTNERSVMRMVEKSKKLIRSKK